MAKHPTPEPALQAELSHTLESQTQLGAQQDQLFRAFVASVQDYAVFMLDPRGIVMTWNVGAERIKGYRATEIIGSHFSTFYPDHDTRVRRCEEELEIAITEGRFVDEGWRVRKDGTEFWASVVISAIRDDHQQLVGFSKITRDLTDRRREEHERTARLAAEQANRAKDDFLAMLGHELRNPLAPIVTALELMKLRGDKASKEHEVIERQVTHLLNLVDDLLDVSRLSRGKVELKRRHLDVRDPIAKAIEIAEPLLEQRRHQLEIDVSSDVLMVDADAARLTQVFTNLLANAAKYTDLGGRIWVSAQRAEDDVLIEVRDDGMGIDPALLPRIFDLFVQGYQSSERAVGGLGLGLTLVRTLVELHGGLVSARSAGAGSGSTFTVRLPIIAAPIKRRLTTPPLFAHAANSRKHVLIVDDNEDARMLLADVLESLGHNVITAPDGPEALKLVKAFTPDVAILDIGLPVMDGFELAVRLRAELAAPPRLIALTGYGQQSDRKRTSDAGFDVHLVKPVNLKDLISSLTPKE
ncbi:MAG: response regulator [Deltaproteobacteria bacterium]|nr:response regulator [Deltaproteobacteria bacterium]